MIAEAGFTQDKKAPRKLRVIPLFSVIKVKPITAKQTIAEVVKELEESFGFIYPNGP